MVLPGQLFLPLRLAGQRHVVIINTCSTGMELYAQLFLPVRLAGQRQVVIINTCSTGMELLDQLPSCFYL